MGTRGGVGKVPGGIVRSAFRIAPAESDNDSRASDNSRDNADAAAGRRASLNGCRLGPRNGAKRPEGARILGCLTPLTVVREGAGPDYGSRLASPPAQYTMPSHGAISRSRCCRRPSVRISAKPRISACGSATCSRAAAAKSVRPLVITSSIRMIFSGVCRDRVSTRNDWKCSCTVGRLPAGACDDLRTVNRRRSATQVARAKPSSLSTRARCAAAHGPLPEGSLPGTGTRTGARAKTPRKYPCRSTKSITEPA
jgi:hypothetical protein